MMCPKCKAKIGVMRHEVNVDTGVVVVARCIICGYWAIPKNFRPVRRSAVRAAL